MDISVVSACPLQRMARRVTEGSVRRRHRAWRDGGAEALRLKGPVSREKLSAQQLAWSTRSRHNEP